MKIVYCGLKNENYDPRRGTSFEYNNFYLSFKNLPGVYVVDHFFDQILKAGRQEYNGKLLELIHRHQPDLLFVFMYTDEIDSATLRKIRDQRSAVKTVAWFADDHWRIHNYSRFYAPYFDWVVTTWSQAPAVYAHYGINNVIHSQWACNPFVWKPKSIIEKDSDVSFVGQWNPTRGKTIAALRQTGIEVLVKGYGWPEGKASQEEMMGILSRSKINLNLNAPRSPFSPRRLARLFFKNSCGRIVFDGHLVSNIRSWLGMSTPQIKARPFEILGCNAFLISAYADDMSRWYEDGKEIVYYDGSDGDLIEKVRYYLNRTEERKRIAQAGYERTLRDHTYQQRLADIFRKLSLI